MLKRILPIFLLGIVFFCSTVEAATFYSWRYRNHATDCPSLTDGKERDLCYEEDSDRFFKCEPTAGNCSGAEWREIGANAVPLKFTLFNPNGVFNLDTQFMIWEDVSVDITINKISITCDSAANEILGDIKWADAFIGFANATVINVFDTSSGVLIDPSITAGAVAAGTDIYGQFDSEPNAAITQCAFSIGFTND